MKLGLSLVHFEDLSLGLKCGNFVVGDDTDLNLDFVVQRFREHRVDFLEGGKRESEIWGFFEAPTNLDNIGRFDHVEFKADETFLRNWRTNKWCVWHQSWW